MDFCSIYWLHAGKILRKASVRDLTDLSVTTLAQTDQYSFDYSEWQMSELEKEI